MPVVLPREIDYPADLLCMGSAEWAYFCQSFLSVDNCYPALPCAPCPQRGDARSHESLRKDDDG